MKTFVFFAALLVAAVQAKRELEIKDCGGENAIITLGSITDSKPAGALDKKSKLTILFSVAESTKHLDPFDIYVEIKIHKRVLGLYFPVPEAIMTGIGKNIEKTDKNVKYVGGSMFKIHCPFKSLYGTCLPPKGPHIETLPLEPTINSIRKTFGVFLRWFANGYYKFDVKALSMKKKSLFCVHATIKIAL